MELRGIVKPGDLYAAELLNMRPSRAYGIVGVLLLFAGLGVMWKGLSAPEVSVATWVVLGCCSLFIFELGVWRPYRLTSNFKQNKNMQREITLSTSDGGILATNENGHLNRPWNDFLKWKEGRKIFLIYVSNAQSLTVPKHFFKSERDIEEFRELLKFKIHQNAA